MFRAEDSSRSGLLMWTVMAVHEACIRKGVVKHSIRVRLESKSK